VGRPRVQIKQKNTLKNAMVERKIKRGNEKKKTDKSLAGIFAARE